MALAPAVIGFSTYLWNIQASLHLAGVLDQLLGETLIVLGGPEAGPRGEELLAEHAEIDFVIDGEGEVALRDLLRWYFTGEGDLGAVAGLVYRQGEVIRRNRSQPMPVEMIPAAVYPMVRGFQQALDLLGDLPWLPL